MAWIKFRTSPASPFGFLVAGAFRLAAAFLASAVGLVAAEDRPPFSNPVDPFPSADAPALPAGAALEHRSFASATLGEPWGYIVYLPPGYARDAEKKFPLILWMHGAGGAETSVRNLNPVSYFWNAMQDGRLPETVIVAPSGLIRSYWHDDAWVKEAGVERAGLPIATAVVRDLLQHLAANFRVRTDRAGRAVTGFSMGGFGAINLALVSGEFGAAVSLDGNVSRRGEESDGFKKSCRNDAALLDRHNLFALLERYPEHARRTRFYFSWSEAFPNGHKRLAELMRAAGVTHQAEDLSAVIDKHHAYRFLVPETGGNNVMALLTATFAAPPPKADPFPAANYDEAKVPPYTLPDPLVCFDGARVADAATWIARRRPEVLRTFETEVYGRVPAAVLAAKPTFRVTAVDARALGGLATRKLVTVHLLGRADGPTMDLLVYVPNAARRPVPAFLGLNFAGNQSVSTDPGVPVTTRWVRSVYLGGKTNRATEAARGVQASRWPIETILARGYAVATVFSGDLEPDHPEGWRDGIRGATKPGGERESFAPDAWGATAAWAWGLSRALDYLVTDPGIDGARVAVHGHSRLGKAALWAGAGDERFALVISNCSGEGGASLMRREFGETIAHANANEPHRFALNFRQYSGAVDRLPVDAHLLIALVAPRPVYIASATEDRLADPRGEFLAAKNAGAVYRLFHRAGLGEAERAAPDQPSGDFVGYHLRTGKHDITISDWQHYLNFADRHLRGPLTAVRRAP